MNAYMAAFERYIREHPMKFYEVEMESLLELFYQCYSEGGMEDSRKMKDCIWKIGALVPPESKDAVFALLCELCEETQRRAFLAGLRAGGQWVMEMRQQ